MVPLVHRSSPPTKPSEHNHQQHHHQRQSTEITVEDQNNGDRSRNNIRVNITNSTNGDPNRSSSQAHGRHTTNGTSGDQSTDSKMADICFVSRKIETKTVTVEVHRGPAATPDDDGADIPPPPPPMAAMTPPCTSLTTSTGRHSSLSSSTMSVPSSCDAVSLSSAISEELKKRKEVQFELEMHFASGVFTIGIHFSVVATKSIRIAVPAWRTNQIRCY